MDSVHKGGIVFHFWRHGTEQMSDPLLVLDVYTEVAHKDDASIRADAFLAPAELP